MSGRLIGVGVGPGDPEHLTLKALRALREADRVFVPAGDGGGPGRAESIVAAHVASERIERLSFAMTDGATRSERWDRAGEAIAEVIRRGLTTAFCTVGDPSLYSTFTYVAQTVRELVPGVAVELVPGITAMQDLAARAGVVLAEGTERLSLFSLTAGADGLRDELAAGDTVVCYKGGSQLDALLDAVADAGRLGDAVYGEQLGLPDQRIAPAGAVRGSRGPYFSTVIVPARRDGTRGGRL
jgi:precorrin-2/cobalt-factor-2 C20-methyltransferase